MIGIISYLSPPWSGIGKFSIYMGIELKEILHKRCRIVFITVPSEIPRFRRFLENFPYNTKRIVNILPRDEHLLEEELTKYDKIVLTNHIYYVKLRRIVLRNFEDKDVYLILHDIFPIMFGWKNRIHKIDSLRNYFRKFMNTIEFLSLYSLLLSFSDNIRTVVISPQVIKDIETLLVMFGKEKLLENFRPIHYFPNPPEYMKYFQKSKKHYDIFIPRCREPRKGLNILERLEKTFEKKGYRIISLNKMDILNEKEYLRYLGDSRILLLPSVFEGLGLPILESVSVGTIAVARDVVVDNFLKVFKVKPSDIVQKFSRYYEIQKIVEESKRIPGMPSLSRSKEYGELLKFLQ